MPRHIPEAILTIMRGRMLSPTGGKDKLIISDIVKLKSEKDFTFIFNLHPDVEATHSFGSFRLSNNGVKLSMKFTGLKKIKTSLSSGRCFLDFTHRETKRIVLKIKSGSDFVLKTEIEEVKI